MNERNSAETNRGVKSIWVVLLVGGLITLMLAFAVSQYASSKPDGLEKVAATHQINTGEKPHAFSDAPFADYSAQGVSSEGLSTGISGLIGVFVTFGVAAGITWLSIRCRSRRDETPALASQPG